ncbi:MAG: DUF4261 domain-containing protein [Oscillospiraceae bacterium]|nr:DUF4261 domain-containing protein [Oscillospiraceae bacterium]
MSDKQLKQDVSDKAPERTMLMAQLLFREKPEEIPVSELQKVVEEIFGEIDLVYDAPKVPFFALKNYRATFQKEEGKEYNHSIDNGDGTISLPVLANFIIGEEFKTELDPLTKSQFWDFKGNFDEFKYHTSVFGMLSGSMYYKQEAELFLKEIEAALRCFPTAEAIYVPHSGKLTTVDYFREGMGLDVSSRFIRTAVNARFFRIEDSEDFVVDTLGFFAFGGADVQVHFHGMKPDDVVNYVYNIASYQFDADFPIKSGDTIDGLDENGKISQEIQWKTQYEDSLIQPVRAVLDINCGEYAAGNRNNT